MSISGHRDSPKRPLSTADLAAAARRREESRPDGDGPNIDDGDVTGTHETVQISDIPPASMSSWETDRAAASSSRPTDDALVASRSPSTAAPQEEVLEPLFTPNQTETYHAQWTSIQSSFVDDPRNAVRQGDELVAQIMANLADTFADERHRVEAQLDDTGEASTENLRIALRRYRSFFERLLSL